MGKVRLIFCLRRDSLAPVGPDPVRYPNSDLGQNFSAALTLLKVIFMNISKWSVRCAQVLILTSCLSASAFVTAAPTTNLLDDVELLQVKSLDQVCEVLLGRIGNDLTAYQTRGQLINFFEIMDRVIPRLSQKMSPELLGRFVRFLGQLPPAGVDELLDLTEYLASFNTVLMNTLKGLGENEVVSLELLKQKFARASLDVPGDSDFKNYFPVEHLRQKYSDLRLRTRVELYNWVGQRFIEEVVIEANKQSSTTFRLSHVQEDRIGLMREIDDPDMTMTSLQLMGRQVLALYGHHAR